MKKIIIIGLAVAIMSTLSFGEENAMSNEDIYLMKVYVNESIRIQSMMSLGEAGTWDEINKNKEKVKKKMRINCKKLAVRMKNKYPNAQIYNYTLKNCVALSFSQLN